MALAWQTFDLVYASGVDTKTDPKQVQGKFLQVQNALYKSPLQLEKRPGYDDLGTMVLNAAALTEGLGATAFGNELVLWDATKLYSYSVADAAWVAKGYSTSVVCTELPVVRNAYQQTAQDGVQHSSGFSVFAWEDSQGGVRYSVVDASSHQVVANALASANGQQPKVATLGGYVLILFVNTSTKNLQMVAINTANPTASVSPVNVVTTLNNTTPVYDTCSVNAQVYVVFSNTVGGSTNISAVFINQSLTVSGVQTYTATAPTCIGCFADPGQSRIFVAYSDGTNCDYLAFLMTTLTSSISATTLASSYAAYSIGGVTDTNETQWIFFTVTNSNALYDSVYLYTLSGGASPTGGVFQLQGSLLSKPFLYNNAPYVVVTFSSQVLQPCYFLLSATGAVIAQLQQNEGGNRSTRPTLAEVTSLDGNNYVVALLQRDQLTVVPPVNAYPPPAQVNFFSASGVVAENIEFFDTQQSYSRAILAKSLNFGGGIVVQYDGISPVEQGFLLGPEAVTATFSTTGGSMAYGASGSPIVYQYTVCWSWTDNQGQTQRSAPCVQFEVSAASGSGGSTGSCAIVVNTLAYTYKSAINAAGSALTFPRTPPVLEVYRSVGQGQEPFMTSCVANGVPYSGTNPVFNTVAANTVTFTDAQADNSINGGLPIYTWGGVVPDQAAPPLLGVTSHVNRLIGISSEDPLVLWFSKQVVPGQAVEFSEFLTWNVDPKGDNCVALASLDTNLLILKETSIRVLVGQGPDDTGQNSDFQESIVTTDTGCISPRSVVVIPSGAMFKGNKGIYLCGRDLSVTYIGADVEIFNQYDIVGAVMLTDANRVHFSLNDPAHTTLVYDYFVGTWGWFNNHNVVDATDWQGNYAYLQPNGNVRVESDGSYVEGGQAISMRSQTSWLKLNGLEGYQSVRCFWLLGQYLSPCTLRISVAYDYAAGPSQTIDVPLEPIFGQGTWGDEATWGGSDATWGSSSGTTGAIELRVDLIQRKCSAIQITIEDLQPTPPYGAGYAISGLKFECGVRPRGKQLPPSQIVGGTSEVV